jgi:hypothetical protein
VHAYAPNQSKKEVIRMRKKQPPNPPRQNEHILHQIGRERFISVQRYVGDFPNSEPVDWFPQSDEHEPSEFPTETDERDNQ